MDDPAGWSPAQVRRMELGMAREQVRQRELGRARQRKLAVQQDRNVEEHRKRHKKTAVEAATTKRERRELIAKTMSRALEGDKDAVQIMMARVSAPLRPVAPPVQFDLDDTDAASTAQSILRAVATGVLNTEQAKDLLAGLSSVVQIAELERMQQQLQDLQEALQEQQRTTATPLPVSEQTPAEEHTDAPVAPSMDIDW